MKELTQDFKATEVKSEIVAPEKREIRLTAQINPIPGLTLWEYALRTGELKKAVFKQHSVAIEGDDKSKRPVLHKRVDSKEEHIYFQALNKKSATKKLNKNGYFVKAEDGK